MTKLDFNQTRGFSDSITFTFNFIKQEFKPLLKTFSLIALPVIFIDLFLRSYMMRDVLALRTDSDLLTNNITAGGAVYSFLTYLGAVAGFIWMLLFVISYLRVYMEKQEQQDETAVTAREIWQVMVPHIGVVVVWSVLYSLIVVVGFLFLIIPGIFFGVSLVFSVYFIILRKQHLFAAMSDAMTLIKGQWWNFFGYLIVLQFIVGALSYIFAIPSMVLLFTSAISHEVPKVYELTFSMLFTALGQYLMHIVLLVGIAVRFYSMLEQKEHSSLLKKIDQIGTTDVREEAF